MEMKNRRGFFPRPDPSKDVEKQAEKPRKNPRRVPLRFPPHPRRRLSPRSIPVPAAYGAPELAELAAPEGKMALIARALCRLRPCRPLSSSRKPAGST